MGMKEFLKPEWKKFILPIALIVLFLVMIVSFHLYSSVMNKYFCGTISLFQELEATMKQNDSLAYERAFNKTVASPFFTEGQNYDELVRGAAYISIFIRTIDPFMSLPCEYKYDYYNFLVNDFCEYYINKETYNCCASLPESSNISCFDTAKPYKGVSLVTQGLNVLLLFLEGYLISCVALFAYRKVGKKKQ